MFCFVIVINLTADLCDTDDTGPQAQRQTHARTLIPVACAELSYRARFRLTLDRQPPTQAMYALINANKLHSLVVYAKRYTGMAGSLKT